MGGGVVHPLIGRYMFSCFFEANMKVDYEYLKRLLESFEKIDVPFPLLSEIASEVSEINNQFAFHMDLLLDQGFIQYMSTQGTSPFEPVSYGPDNFDYANVNVRLTAQGYDFLAALHQKNIWNAIKGDLKDNSIQTIWKVAQSVATKLASTQIEKYVDSKSII
ncbi:DUF2513 domain-containing protein [Vibrio anguillarum]|uniref:DUF2513 domain-containing protein n=1 Tax=Vibrio anguillarum TaxID=55601 RepID=A0AAW4BJ43_VIBAN|nr:DUF2513 domain-containing protein [Vibrio anguillarum]